MSPLLISLAAGVLIGLIYALLNVRSPAPPAVALVGLLGMIVGSTLGGKLIHSDASASLEPGTHSLSVADKPSLTMVLNAKQAG